MFKANFNITETGGTGEVKLQGSTDSGATWLDIASTLTLVNSTLSISDSDNISIDPDVFAPGYSYLFRLIDASGTPIGNVISYRIPAITSYAAGTSAIGFTSTGGDNWQANFYIAPATYQSPGGFVITDYAATITFYSAGNPTVVFDDDLTADHTAILAGSGAGVYLLQCDYYLSDGTSQFEVDRLVKVDAAGNIIADIQFNGSTASAVSGLTMTQTAEIVQTGVSYPVDWYAGPSAVLLGSGLSPTFTLPIGTVLISVNIVLDSVFTDDFTGHENFYRATIVTS